MAFGAVNPVNGGDIMVGVVGKSKRNPSLVDFLPVFEIGVAD